MRLLKLSIKGIGALISLIILSYFTQKFVFYNGHRVEFFGILGSLATIIGFYLTLFQIYKIRSIAETSIFARKEANKVRFMYEAESSIEKFKETLDKVGDLFLQTTQFDDKFIQENIASLNIVLSGLKVINIDHKKATYIQEFQCDECINCLEKFVKELFDDLTTKSETQITKRHTYFSDLQNIKDKLFIIKGELKHERESK